MAMNAVILQYHHVSETTPKSTSITPQQFEKHLSYLANNHFNVVPLSTLVDAIKKQQTLPDKTVAITFDDAYKNVLENATPLLNQFNFPYTIFVNPAIINRQSSQYLTWQQLKFLGNKGVIIANHGLEHNSLARRPKNTDKKTWIEQQIAAMIKAEEMIHEKTGQNWRYFAYPYGEYTLAIQQAIAKQGFIAFGQQSGAVGYDTNLVNIPRFPASIPYDKLSSLKDKLHALAMTIKPTNQQNSYVLAYDKLKAASFNIQVNDFNKTQLSCYVTNLGKQAITWQNDEQFTLHFSDKVPSGRIRANCTAPSISKRGRFYWYSQPWFVLRENGDWYPL